MFTWSTSRARLSSAAIILTACPGILCDTVLRRTLGPVNFTSTSATGDFEFAARSAKVCSDEGEDSIDGGIIVAGKYRPCCAILGLYGLPGWGVRGLIGKPTLGLSGGGSGRGLTEGRGLEMAGRGLSTSLYTFLCFLASKDCNTCCSSLM